MWSVYLKRNLGITTHTETYSLFSDCWTTTFYDPRDILVSPILLFSKFKYLLSTFSEQFEHILVSYDTHTHTDTSRLRHALPQTVIFEQSMAIRRHMPPQAILEQPITMCHHAMPYATG